ncbi:hypothetical protein APHDU1_0288 [Anaplasma phagocytophilum]|nr:hypothetical protein APHWEB_1009 [Anaplasma phagocytophilum str. Webster]KKA00025.1 hypothetical protein APHDU1_0288 [Anaplasma phagocytophilum]
MTAFTLREANLSVQVVALRDHKTTSFVVKFTYRLPGDIVADLILLKMACFYAR